MIVKRGKVYYSRIWHHGRLHHRSLRTRDKNQALQLDAAFKTALVTGEHVLTKCPTLAEFEERFFAHIKIHVKPRTHAFYKEQFKVLTESALGKMPLTLIDVAAVDDFKQWRLAQKVAVVTTNHAIRTLRRALHQAEDWHLIKRAPVLRLMRGEHSREAVISNEELQEMIDYSTRAYPKSNFQFLLPFLVDTGLRISEACRVKRDDVWLGEEPYVRVTEGKSKSAKREVRLTSRAVVAVEKAWEKSRCSYVFTAYGGRRPMTRHYAAQQFRLLADCLNMDRETVLHSCRHTFCTRLGESGADVYTIMELAGHSTVAISQRYVHEGKAIQQDAIKRMEVLSKKKEEPEVKGKGKPGEVIEV